MKRSLTAFFFAALSFNGFSQLCIKPVSPHNTGSGSGPISVCAADFDGDGKKDLAVTRSGNNNIGVFAGTGTGLFTAGNSYNTGSYPYGVVSADFNGDSKPDLAVSNFGNNSISVLLNSGTGVFGTAVNYVAGSSPLGICTGDFNSDSNIDLAVTCNNTVCIMTGSGNGAFALTATYPLNASALLQAVESADFNGDGKADLVAADAAGTIGILLNNGNGTFATPAVMAVPTDPIGVVIADFNGDGKKDLAVSHTAANTVSFLFGTGTGNFTGLTNYNVGSGAGVGSSADLDGDGDEDYVSANYGGNNIGILLNTGNGTFKPVLALALTPFMAQPIFAVTAELNGDGRPDVIAVNHTSDNLNIFISGMLPVISVSPPTPSVCEGNGITLSANGTNTYSWTNIGPGASIVVSPLVNTTYTVNGGLPGCITTTTVEVTVEAPPLVSVLPAAQTTICAGEYLVASATGASSYTWMPSGIAAASLTLSPPGSSNYSVVASSANGCTASASMYVAVAPCTGIAAEQMDTRVKIYPNPSSGNFTIELQHPFLLEVRDVTGKMILSENYSSGKQTLHFEDTLKGLYFLKVSSDSGQQTFKLLVE